MAPRPAASRHDASARLFLDTAASLIDAAMTTSDAVPPRLRSIKFPAALEWIRVEDVIRLTSGAPGGSRKAFHQRWETRDTFIADAVVYTLQFVDRPDDEYTPLMERMGALDLEDLGDGIASVATELLNYAESQPRSYLMLHIGGVLHRHPDIQQSFRETWEPLRTPFLAGYVNLLERLKMRLRPDWTPERFDRALQAIVDGFLLQGRIHWDDVNSDTWTHTLLFAETVLAFTLGVLDTEGLRHTSRYRVTQLARTGTGSVPNQP